MKKGTFNNNEFESFFRRLLEEDTRLPSFLSMQKIADVVGPKVFVSYISKLTAEQKKIYDDLTESRARVEDRLTFDDFLRQNLTHYNAGLPLTPTTEG